MNQNFSLNQLKGIDKLIYILGNSVPLSFTELEKMYKIPKSSLARYLKDKKKNQGFFEMYNKKWRLTTKGRDENRRILNFYKLDERSFIQMEKVILLDRIEKIKNFFKSHKIKNSEKKLLFKKLYLNVNYDRIEKLIPERIFNLIILYIVQHHPNFYNQKILSQSEFIEKYFKLSDRKKESFKKYFKSCIEYFLQEPNYPRLYKIEINLDALKTDFYLLEDDIIIKTLYIEIDDEIEKAILLNIENEKGIEIQQKREIILKIKKRIIDKKIIKFGIIHSKFIDNLIKDRIWEKYVKNLPEIRVNKLGFKSSYPIKVIGYCSLETPFVKIPTISQDSQNTVEKIKNYREKCIDDYLEESAFLCDEEFNFDKALEKVNEGLEYFPESPALWINKAMILRNSGKLNEALDAIENSEFLFEKIDSLEEEDYNAYKIEILCRKTLILIDLERYEDAKEINKKALELQPENLDLIYQNAKLLIISEKEEEAIGFLEYYFEKEPNNIEIIISLATCKSNLKYYQEGLDLIEKGLSLKPPLEDKLYLLNMKIALYLFHFKDLDRALNLIEYTELKNYPESTINAYIWYGVVLIGEENYNESIDYFDKGLSLIKYLDPGYKYEIDEKSIFENINFLRDWAEKGNKNNVLTKIDSLIKEFKRFEKFIKR